MSHCPSWGLSFSNLCSGAKDLSLLPVDCLEIGLGRKQGSFSHLTNCGGEKKNCGDVVLAPETLPNSRLE